MSLFHKNTLLGASGAGGAAEALYVDDVFSAFPYEGNSSTSRSIDNGIDLSGEGGLVWFARRDTGAYKPLFDTERGATKALYSNDTLGTDTASTDLTAFNNNGFTIAQGATVNANGGDYFTSTFRKAPGFFDVVTWTGDGTDGREIPHSLGSAPGMVIIKRTDSSEHWMVYHRSLTTKYGSLNNAVDFSATGSGFGGYNMQEVFGNSTSVILPDANNITVARFGASNADEATYVAYLFAHDDQSFGTDSDEAIIKCGEYTEGSSGVEIDLGFEPQWILLKQYQAHSPGGVSSAYWTVINNMTGMFYGSNSPFLYPNTNTGDGLAHFIDPLPNGFRVKPFWGATSKSIYVAIRRPHKPPTDGTDVFAAQASRSASTGTPSQLHFTSNFPVDLLFQLCRAGNSANAITVDRIRGGQYLQTNNALAEQSTIWKFDSMDGVYFTTSTSATSDFGANMFRRYPGVFDVVGYDGSGGNQTINHNLKVIPELMIIKARNDGQSWLVYPGDEDEYLLLDTTGAQAAYSFFNSTAPTSTQFTIGSSWSATGKNYIAYLFATLDGISKVGTYSGGGSSDVDVDCGFTSGARFVLIKRTDSSGGWYAWDTARGIATGNDPYLELDSTAAETTNTDYIDPLNSGFTVVGGAGPDLNSSTGTYIFLAIA